MKKLSLAISLVALTLIGGTSPAQATDYKKMFYVKNFTGETITLEFSNGQTIKTGNNQMFNWEVLSDERNAVAGAHCQIDEGVTICGHAWNPRVPRVKINTPCKDAGVKQLDGIGLSTTRWEYYVECH